MESIEGVSGPFALLLRPADWDWGSVPDWLVLLTAVVGTILALRQLRKATEANRAYLRAEQGTQLMAIDDKFEVELKASRRALALLWQACQDHSRGDSSLIGAIAASRLNFLYQRRRYAYSTDAVQREAGLEADEEYFVLMQLPLFIETIGVLTTERLASEAMVLKLYDAAIGRGVGLVMDHIRWRRRRDGSATFLENAEAIYRKTTYGRVESARHDANLTSSSI